MAENKETMVFSMEGLKELIENAGPGTIICVTVDWEENGGKDAGENGGKDGGEDGRPENGI